MSIFFLAKNPIIDWAFFSIWPAAQMFRWATQKLDFINSTVHTVAYHPGGGVNLFTLNTLLLVHKVFTIL